jgi:hypothetical protein
MASANLNPHVLDREKVRIIKLQSELVRDRGFFLAGGTGLALRLGHRLSHDLDWFTPERFTGKDLQRRLEALAEKPTTIVQQSAHTVRAYYGTLETSFISYNQVPAAPEAVTLAGAKFPLADLEVMAAMKAAAVHDRGARRDFLDIYAITHHPGWSVSRFITHAARVLPLTTKQVALALTYFADADNEPMPHGVKISWHKVKTELAKEVQTWERNRGGAIER